MTAQEILEIIRSESADTQQVLATLEDGEALAALGITDQEAVEEAHYIVSQQIEAA